MSTQHEDRLDQELDHILLPLGVNREVSSAENLRQEQHGKKHENSLHITCVYDQADERLWRDLARHFFLLRHPQQDGELCWHEAVLSKYLPPCEVERAAGHFMQSPLILLGVSIDLLVAFRDRARATYQALVQASQEQGPQIVLVMLRPVAWEDENLLDPLILPQRGTITTRQYREQSHVEIAQGVRKAIRQLCL